MPTPTPPQALFPASLPVLNDVAAKGSGDRVTGEGSPYRDSNQQAVEIKAVAAKLGVDGSTDPDSIDYRTRDHASRLLVLADRPTVFGAPLPTDLRTGLPSPSSGLRAQPDGTPYVDPRGRLFEWRLGSLRLVSPRDSLDLLDAIAERGYRNGGTAALQSGGAGVDFDSPIYQTVVLVRRTVNRLPRLILPVSNATSVSADVLLSVQAGLCKAVPNNGSGYRRWAPGPLFRNCRYQALGVTGQNIIDTDVVPLYPIDGAPPTAIPPGVYYVRWTYRLRGTTVPSIFTRSIMAGANATFKGDRVETSGNYATALWSSTAIPATGPAGLGADWLFDAELRP